MLVELHLRNVAVVAEASFELGPGLAVLTGETGAGKSIVVDSLALLAGARASSDVIRAGAESLVVSAVFRPAGTGWMEVLRGLGLEPAGEELVIRREVSRSGRSRAFLDDQPVTVRALADLGPHLVAIHGQREEATLLSPEEQRAWLDVAGGAEAETLLEAVRAAFDAWREAAARLERLEGDERLRHERLDLLRFQLEEIDAVDPRAGEDEELRREREVLRHAEAILGGLTNARDALSEDEPSAAGRLVEARVALEAIASWDENVAGWLVELEEAVVRLEDVAMSVARRLDEVEVDPARLGAVEERLAALERLLRKHGGSTRELLERRAAMQAELTELETDERDREAVARRAAKALEAYQRVACELSSARARWGERLAAGVVAELADLALARARFSVALETRPSATGPLVHRGRSIEIGPSGFDAVEFQFAANPGEELRPLARVASGGELARVALALRLVARGDAAAPPAVLVFDEVDSGVGGGEAAALGRKLQRVARGGQVVAVTHLPQVAAHGDWHLRVSKSVERDQTFVVVEPLDSVRRVEEIARMLAGHEVTELSRSHAKELIAVSARPDA